ncbi:TetR family transcriptional regulator [Maribellus comscasis]|uniref:TetR family transcriptional regulator n=1 Tax=Maribellus comscasis TaxID=2681766 RepID=A0A6I6JJR8_9BACT|nr:TetR/AcrR family transcriptional regulator [Maribellus comscasis]QGY42521.1 TetR family transcriptional regulator [Maribellus comscasis]
MINESPKYSDIIITARKLFWKHGISRVSIEEICREANVSKMTFYRFFSNKVELGKTIIDNIMDESIEKYRSLMKQDIPFEEKIRKQLLLKFEGTKEISAEFVKDIYSNKKLGLHLHWQKRADEFTKEVRYDYIKAQNEGFIRKDLNLDFMFYFSSKSTDLLTDPQLLKMYDNMQDLIMEYANLFFFGVFPRHNEKSKP